MTGHAPSLLENRRRAPARERGVAARRAAGGRRDGGEHPLAGGDVADANVEDFQFVAIVYGPLVALVGIAALRWRATRFAGALASVLFMMLTTHAIGLLAMLGLTAGMPLIDAQLAAADLRLGVDHHAIAALAAEHRAPPPACSAMSTTRPGRSSC